MSRRGEHPRGAERWVYESIVASVPGLTPTPAAAALLQFVGFELVLLALATVYGRWEAVPAGTVAIVVASGGSAFMHDLGRRVRRISLPAAYGRVLFGSSLDVLLGVVAYAAVITYLFVLDPRSGGSLLSDLLGSQPPPAAVFFLLIVLWDVTYRIGTGWWAAVTSLWGTLRLEIPTASRPALRAVDRRTIAFALLQTLLIPVLLSHPVLAGAVFGHVLAVLVVLGMARMLTDRS